ncbi:MAG TPA: energy-coupling factor transporter ATPase [Syntrophomonadaceae bacterium]|nr:energy-coupling factor transporter ATPase [Syntrophomonadaceae bacterium]
MISLRNVSYTYPHSNQAALVNITLDIAVGEFIAVVGKNASGKSTLARLLNGMLIPSSGLITVDGLKITDKQDLVKIRKKVGLLLPSPDNQIIFNLVEEDVAFGPGNLGLPTQEIRDRVDTALRMVSMEEFKKHPPYLLSGGQKQKVALAGLLAMNPEYLVLDEPTVMLDSQSKQSIIQNIIKINRNLKTTVIMITHDLEEVIHADRIVLLDEGTIKGILQPSDLSMNTEKLEKLGIEQIEVIKLIDKLKAKAQGKLQLSSNSLTVEELVEEICQLS